MLCNKISFLQSVFSYLDCRMVKRPDIDAIRIVAAYVGDPV